MVLGIISGVISAIGAIRQGNAAYAAGTFNAKVAEANAVASEQQGQAAADAQQRDAQRRLGSMIAAYGASGVSSAEGSASEALADSVRMATLDNLTTRYNYQLRAADYRTEAELNKMNAKNARTAGYFSAASSLLGAFSGGVGSYSGTYTTSQLRGNGLM